MTRTLTLHVLRETIGFPCQKEIFSPIDSPLPRDGFVGFGRWTGILANFRLSHQKFRAIDLSCRACGAGAGCWAWIPGRGTCGVHPQPPTIILKSA